MRQERHFSERSTLDLHGHSESEVAQVDGAPCEDGGEATDGHEPVEDGVLGFDRTGTDECKQSKERDCDDAKQRSSLSINVSEEGRSLTLLGESSDSSRETKDRGVADGQNGNHNDDVHDRWKALDAGSLDGNDERRGGSVSRRALVEQLGVVPGNKEADQSQRHNIEEGNSPEDLLGSSGDGLSGIGGLGSSQASQLSSVESKGSRHEDGTDSLGTSRESAGVVPVSASDVVVVGSSSTGQNNSENDESDHSNDFNKRKVKLGFSVALDSEKLMETISTQKIATQQPAL